ncbi:unnamed protein product [Miscanthus lutarioriparius]|uniref:Uncharacterized protein n=1 Tax=Miscanthus lutarioriparius TaxID=422564 RepID=A0A811R9K9_9POAL|nr:unnamed protein product [Miscanthus lutarioriparius]
MGYDAPRLPSARAIRGGDTAHDVRLHRGLRGRLSMVGDFIKEMMTFAGAASRFRTYRSVVEMTTRACSAPGAGILASAMTKYRAEPAIAALGYNTTSFYYCLLDFLSSPASYSSTLTFGVGAVETSPPASFTPTVWNPNMGTFYYVRLIGVSVGGMRVLGVTECDLQLDPYTCRSGIILDSAPPRYTACPPRCTSQIHDAFRTAAADLGQVSIGGPSGFFDTCYIMGRGSVMVAPQAHAWLYAVPHLVHS